MGRKNKVGISMPSMPSAVSLIATSRSFVIETDMLSGDQQLLAKAQSGEPNGKVVVPPSKPN